MSESFDRGGVGPPMAYDPPHREHPAVLSSENLEPSFRENLRSPSRCFYFGGVMDGGNPPFGRHVQLFAFRKRGRRQVYFQKRWQCLTRGHQI